MDARKNRSEKNGSKDTQGDASPKRIILPKHVVDEIQKEIDKVNSAIEKALAKHPHHAFFDTAVDFFEGREADDFDEFAGRAMNHSGRSLLMEIALTLMKIIMILEEKYSKFTAPETTEEGLKKDHFTRLFLVLRIVEELIMDHLGDCDVTICRYTKDE